MQDKTLTSMHSVRLEPTKSILIGTRTTYQATWDAGFRVHTPGLHTAALGSVLADCYTQVPQNPIILTRRSLCILCMLFVMHVHWDQECCRFSPPCFVCAWEGGVRGAGGCWVFFFLRRNKNPNNQESKLQDHATKDSTLLLWDTLPSPTLIRIV